MGINIEYKEFKIGDVLECYNGKYVDSINRKNNIEGEFRLPIVSSKTSNNGIYAFVKDGNFRIFEDCLSVTKFKCY